MTCKQAKRTFRLVACGKWNKACLNLLTILQKDGITWVIEASTTKEQRVCKRMVQQVISVFFASAHQLPVVSRPCEYQQAEDNVDTWHQLLMFATYRLCEQPGHIKLLVDEIEAMLQLPETEHYKHLPFMESFLREVARHDPLDCCTCLCNLTSIITCRQKEILTIIQSVRPAQGSKRLPLLRRKLRPSRQRNLRAPTSRHARRKTLRATRRLSPPPIPE